MIESLKNDSIKLIHQLKTTRGRKKANKYYIEGIKIILEAIEYNKKVEEIYYTDRLKDTELGLVLFKRAESEKIILIEVSEIVMRDICDTETNQGVIAILRLEENLNSIEKLVEDRCRVLILDQLQDPGNLGTIIRTADALGFKTIFCLKGTVDCYNPKVLRSTMGSIFNVDIMYCEDNKTLADELHQYNFKILATAPSDAVDIKNIAYEKIALVIGNEGNGISDDLFKLSDERVTIVMKGRAESLNAAMAAGICMYALS